MFLMMQFSLYVCVVFVSNQKCMHILYDRREAIDEFKLSSVYLYGSPYLFLKVLRLCLPSDQNKRSG